MTLQETKLAIWKTIPYLIFSPYLHSVKGSSLTKSNYKRLKGC